METVIMNPIGKGFGRYSLSKLNPSKTKKKKSGGKSTMAKKKSKGKKHGKKHTSKKSKKALAKMLAGLKKWRKSRKAKKASAPVKAVKKQKKASKKSSWAKGLKKSRPIFYKINASTIRRSPRRLFKGATMLNPLKSPVKFVKSTMSEITGALPEVVYAGAGYVGIGYVGNLITSTTGFKFMDNAPMRQGVKLLITVGLSAVAGMWNKKASKGVLLGGMLNVAQDVWNSYEVFKMIPINVPSLPPAGGSSAGAGAGASTPSSEEGNLSTLISDKEMDTLITGGSDGLF